MTLRKKLLWLFVLPLTFVLLVVYILSQTIMLDRLDQEDDLLLANEARRIQALMTSIFALDLDRLQSFAERMSDKPGSQTIDPEALRQLSFSFLLQLDTAGGLQAEQWLPVDLLNQPLLPTNGSIDFASFRAGVHRRAAQLGTHKKGKESQVGLVVVEGVPIILASVLIPSHGGEPRRLLIAGHLLNSSRASELQSQLNGTLRVLSSDQYVAKSAPQTNSSVLDNSQVAISTRRLLGDHQQQIALLFSQRADDPQLVLELTRERRLYNEGRKAINLFMAISTAIALLAWLLIYIGLEFLLLRRVSRMHDEFARIGPDASGLRLSESGQDELSYLAHEANQTLERLEQSEARDRAILDAIQEGYFELDIHGEIRSVNRALSEHLGYESEYLVGLHVQSLQDEYTHEQFLTLLKNLEHNSAPMFSGKLRRKDGSLGHYETRVSTILDAKGCVCGYRGILHDVSSHVEYQSQLLDIAYRDALTGLGNRKAFYEHLHQRLNEASGPLALLFIDLDRFKQVNDGFGHDVGDALLVHMAQRLRSAVRKPDQAYRLGGDEFTLIMSADVEDALSLAQRLRTTLGQPVVLDTVQIDFVTPSIGVALYPHHAEDSDSLIKAADQAMYEAKQRGRNEVVLFSAEC
ncbi:diguanylate cyclase [Pseudomonas alkylphenolica]|uniref:diguanylate cyclase n=1 Tax=Pseudomonas alkylphenolica TaxID=237609 RepID=UPI0018D6D3B0|nr:diguanylate cyclase [Pseudomonas alkylphenolica]MBH3426706.1 diguanylate cyclase [Pseudomonas alkylphenolica]